MGKKNEAGNLVTCPECEKPVNAQGFVGHMRFKHGIVKNSKEVFKGVKNEATNAEKAVRLFEIMDRLDECRKRKDRVEGMDNGPIVELLWRDEAVCAIRRGLELQEANILEELRDLGYVQAREDS